MKKKIYSYIANIAITLPLLGAAGGMLTSCDSYLDKEFDAAQSDEKVFGDETMTRGFLANIYNYMEDGIGVWNDDQRTGSSRDCMTDNSVCWWNLHYYSYVQSDSYTSNNHTLLGFWNTDTYGIRACNQYIDKADPTVVGNAARSGDDNRLYDRSIQEAKLLRALFTFDLVQWFGAAPIITKVLSTDEAHNMTRVAAGDVLLWVAGQCDEVIQSGVLPMRYQNEATNWGRVNGCMAHALKSRALLYAASPLNADKHDAANKENGIVPEAYANYSTQSWQYAKEAAETALQVCSANGYGLNGTKGNYDTSSEGDYYKVFCCDPTQSNEIILSRSTWQTLQVEKLLMPPGFTGSGFSPVGRTNPTQNLVDAYETINGLPIDQDPEYNAQKPYANRDPRLDQTIFHQGSFFGAAGNSLGRSVDVREGATDADYREEGEAGGTYTGYWQKKYVYNIDRNNATLQTHFWILFRYAELLLNAAEAEFQTGNVNEAVAHINEVRARAGMPGYTTGNLTMERIQNERRVEFAFEDHRFFDVRRWKLYDNQTAASEKDLPYYKQIYNLYGTIVKGTADSPTYEYGPSKAHSSIVFNTPKNYLFPLPYAEVKAAPGLGQNAGW